WDTRGRGDSFGRGPIVLTNSGRVEGRSGFPLRPSGLYFWKSGAGCWAAPAIVLSVWRLPARGQTNDSISQYRQFIVLVGRPLHDLGIVRSIFLERSLHFAIDIERIADRIVATNLHFESTQKPMVAHPVGQMM